MRTSLTILASLSLTLLFLSIGLVASKTAEAQGAHSFNDTCHEPFLDGSTLVAMCQRVDGSFRRSEILLRGIENVDGRLARTSDDRPANFQGSCNRQHVSSGIIVAYCRRLDGNYQRTATTIDGIENIDGHLRYTDR